MALVNALLVRWSGGLHWVEDAAAIAERGYRVEGYLELGGAGSIGEVERAARAVLANRSAPVEALIGGLEPSAGGDPYIDFNVGDWLTVDHPMLGEDLVRVRGLTVAEDEMGDPIFAPEIGTLQESKEQLLQRWLKRMSNGALGGSVESATPVAKQDRPVAGFVVPSDLNLRELPPHSYGGPLVASVGGRYYLPAAVTVTSVFASLRVPGSTTTTVWVFVNNDLVLATLSLGAGEYTDEFTSPFDLAAGDFIQTWIVAAGEDAENLTVQYRYG